VPRSGDSQRRSRRAAFSGALVAACLAAPATASARDLDAYYGRVATEDGLTFSAPSGVSDAAIDEAIMVVRHEVAARPDVRARLARAGVRFTVMARDDTLTDVPEYHDTLPSDWGMTPAEIDGRARGLGGFDWRRPTVAAEENLTCAASDRWKGYSVATHEFAHQVMATGLTKAELATIHKAFRAARTARTWKGYYAERSEREYFAEGATWWFEGSTWKGPDGVVTTRASLQRRDPALGRILKAVFGDSAWRLPRHADRSLSCTPAPGARAFPPITKPTRGGSPSHGTDNG
jgi:hypothetical protein